MVGATVIGALACLLAHHWHTPFRSKLLILLEWHGWHGTICHKFPEKYSENAIWWRAIVPIGLSLWKSYDFLGSASWHAVRTVPRARGFYG